MKISIFLFRIMLLALLSIGYQHIQAQSAYVVTHYSKADYGAGNQNWSMDVDQDGFKFIANNEGFLIYDDAHWQLHSMPGRIVVRSVLVNQDKRIYVGAFEEFGYWQENEDEGWHYHSLKPLLKDYRLHNNEIWKIVKHQNKIYFQSFSSLFVYDQHTVKSISLPGNVVFLLSANNRLFIQQVGGGLFEIKNDKCVKIQGSDIFSGTEVKTILPFTRNTLLIGTTSNGIFIYNDQNFIAWNSPANDLLKQAQINNAMKVNDNYIIGTIVNGIFVLDQDGNIIHHLSEENALQDNTVLSLCIDKNKNIWAGLDKGIDLITFNNPIQIFKDKKNQIGSVYAASFSGDDLYIGTNRGIMVYQKSGNSFTYNGLLNNSQGQVWELKNIDGELFCGHTNGTFTIKDNKLVKISNVNGGFALQKFSKNGKNYLIQSTYSSLVIYRYVNGKWVFSHEVEGYLEPSRFIEVDHLGNIWVSHTVKGLYQLTLSDDLKQVVSTKHLGQKDGFPSDYKIQVFSIENRIVFTSGHTIYTWDDLDRKVIPYDELNKQLQGFESSTRIVPAFNNLYWFINKADIALFEIRNNIVKLKYRLLLPLYKINMVDAYENIVPLDEKLDLICLDNGFAIFDLDYLSRTENKDERLIFRDIYSWDARSGMKKLNIASGSISLSHQFNNISITFTAINNPCPAKLFQFNLENIDPGWSSWSVKAEARYTRLPAGSYTFKVRTLTSTGKLSDPIEMKFKILAPWYQTNLAIILYALLLIGFLIYRNRLFKKRVAEHKENLFLEAEEKRRIEKEQAEKAIMKIQNEKFQAEISHKSIQLANSTKSILKKNEVLIEIKNELESQKEILGSRYPGRYYERIISLINRNISSDHDWELFESLFDQAHEDFFKRLKSKFPDLTQSDLKLCAYLRLNLASKEIAPLLNISHRGVEIRRYRLRKRLELSSEANLTNFIMQF